VIGRTLAAARCHRGARLAWIVLGMVVGCAGRRAEPGACADLDGGASCEPVVLATAQGLCAITADETAVYWTSNLDGEVVRFESRAGARSVLATGLNRPCALAVDTMSVYWAEYLVPGPTSPDGQVAIRKVPLEGGTPVDLASAPGHPVGIAVDATSVYWLAGDSDDLTEIMQAPLTGGSAATLVSGQQSIRALAADGTRVYWVDYAAGAVLTAAVADGAPIVRASSQTHPWSIAVDVTSVYWTSEHAVLAAPITGGDARRIASSATLSPLNVAVDAASVYWTSYPSGSVGPGSVMESPLGGSPACVLTQGQVGGGLIAVGGGKLYWTAGDSLMMCSR
jgi:hypothetical protein